MRDDALLVLVFIQDFYDLSPDNPSLYAGLLHQAKGGNRDALLGLAITTDQDAEATCFEHSIEKNPMRVFMEDRIDHGRMAPICADSYAPFFDQLVDDLVVLCQGFIPQ